MKSYTVVLEKWTPLYTTLVIQVDDGIAAAEVIEALRVAALDEACAIGPVRNDPKDGSWSLRCPADAASYVVPVEGEPEVILVRSVSAASIMSSTQDENQVVDRLAMRRAENPDSRIRDGARRA